MLDELKQCLLLYTTEEATETLLDAYRILETIGLTDQDTELLNIMGLDSEASDSYLLVGRIEACLTIAVGDQLSQYGVTLMDGTPLNVMTEVLQAVGTFERYHIPEAVRDIFLTDEFDNEEKFAEFVSLFSGLEPIDVTHHLENIKPDTLKRIQTIADDELANVPKPELPLQELRERGRFINLIERKSPEQHLMVVRKLSDYGFPMNVDVDLVLDDLTDALDTIPDDTEQLVYELLAVSAYIDRDYQTFFDEFVEDYAHTDVLANRLKRLANTFLTEHGYSHAKA